VGNLRHYSWGLQLHVGINRLVLWIRNPQLLCHPHQLRQRPGPHLLHDSPTLNFDGEFGRSQLGGDLLFACFLQRPVLIVSFGDGAVRINTRNSSPFDAAGNRVVSQTLAFHTLHTSALPPRLIQRELQTPDGHEAPPQRSTPDSKSPNPPPLTRYSQ
jgi:hypothetical protein